MADQKLPLSVGSGSAVFLKLIDNGDETHSFSVVAAGGDSGGATEGTLQEVRDAIKALKDLEESMWTDDSGAFYMRRIVVNEGTGAITGTFTQPDGTSATPGSGLKPVSSTSKSISESLWDVIANGTGYSIGDVLTRYTVIDTTLATPVVATFWRKQDGTALSSVTVTDLKPQTEAVQATITSSALPTGAATAAKQDVQAATLGAPTDTEWGMSGNATLAAALKAIALALGAKADTAVTNPATAATLSANLKGLLTLVGPMSATAWDGTGDPANLVALLKAVYAMADGISAPQGYSVNTSTGELQSALRRLKGGTLQTSALTKTSSGGVDTFTPAVWS